MRGDRNRETFIGVAIALAALAAPVGATAAGPDEPAGGMPASCGGVVFSDHATGNAGATMREVIHDEIPELTEATGLSQSELASLFVHLHESTFAGCETALFEALFG